MYIIIYYIGLRLNQLQLIWQRMGNKCILLYKSSILQHLLSNFAQLFFLFATGERT